MMFAAIALFSMGNENIGEKGGNRGNLGIILFYLLREALQEIECYQRRKVARIKTVILITSILLLILLDGKNILNKTCLNGDSITWLYSIFRCVN